MIHLIEGVSPGTYNYAIDDRGAAEIIALAHAYNRVHHLSGNIVVGTHVLHSIKITIPEHTPLLLRKYAVIKNAVQHIPPGGDLSITADNRTAGAIRCFISMTMAGSYTTKYEKGILYINARTSKVEQLPVFIECDAASVSSHRSRLRAHYGKEVKVLPVAGGCVAFTREWLKMAASSDVQQVTEVEFEQATDIYDLKPHDTDEFEENVDF